MRAVLLENIRSAYNVWNIIRTADALWFDVIISWYTPSPSSDEKVRKTSLWAEKSINIYEFWNAKEGLIFAKDRYWVLVGAEISDKAKPLDTIRDLYPDLDNICIVFGNEVEWVLPESLEFVDNVFYIPMKGNKESLNVWQSVAIFMRELARKR